MQSIGAFAPSSSPIPSLHTRSTLPQRRRRRRRLGVIVNNHLQSSSLNAAASLQHSLPSHGRSAASNPTINSASSSFVSFGRWINHSLPLRRKDFAVEAISIADGDSGSSIFGSSSFQRTFELGSMFAIWYSFNVVWNVIMKQTFSFISGDRLKFSQTLSSPNVRARGSTQLGQSNSTFAELNHSRVHSAQFLLLGVAQLDARNMPIIRQAKKPNVF
ncbi:hypothetical protein H6P81_009837 [Aristolochia fimbriata]|uniref:Uncharacterized protein n=1 Tax=Aristolochia fimbriata TaxID=158543 RepID=A0AAV7EM16_ARIFI|nr:hypothetical protein H6P81_009837 [Aristolochia fimbriata]